MRRFRALFAREPGWVVAVLAAIFLAGSVRHFTAKRGRGGGPEVRIGADGRYHWAYLTSMVLDRDLDLANQYANPRSGNYYEYTVTSTGRYANPFPIGAAILWAPFFVVAYGISRLAEPPAESADGNSYLTQTLTLYSSLLMSFAGALLAYAMARRRYGPGAALGGAVAALLGGPLLQYVANQPSYAHAPSSFACALLLYVWAERRGPGGERSLRGWLGLGALVGLAMLVRAQNLVFAAPVVGEAAATLARAARRQGATAALRAAAAPLAGAVVAVLVFSPQMIAWKTIYGSWIAVPQGPGYMRWSEPLWSETLFSSRNGLFPYAPLWALGILGLALVTRREPRLGAALGVTFALCAYVNGAAGDWSGGGAYGGRRFDGLYVHVTLGFAAIARAFVEAVARRPHVAGGLAVAGVLVFGVTCNYLMVEDFRRHRVNPQAPRDMLAYYLRVAERVGKAIGRAGNPLSWPGAWAFALRTGASPARYDEVVGAFFLTDFELEAYRKPMDRRHDVLRLADAAHAKFLVRGFGEPQLLADGSTRQGRVAFGGRARLLLPFNHAGGVGLRLVGTALRSTTIRVFWNGKEAAVRALTGGAAIDLSFEISADQVERGVNVVDLVHENVPVSEGAALYERIEMVERR